MKIEILAKTNSIPQIILWQSKWTHINRWKKNSSIIAKSNRVIFPMIISKSQPKTVLFSMRQSIFTKKLINPNISWLSDINKNYTLFCQNILHCKEPPPDLSLQTINASIVSKVIIVKAHPLNQALFNV